MRYSDPIVDEVRAARDAIAKECDYDIEKLSQALKAREALSGRQVVRLSPKKVTVAKKAAG
jgi:UDP-N-acetylmuramyl pentapeptide synthase